VNDVWRVRLLGGLRAERGDEIVSRFRSQKIGALLAFLAINLQRSHAREELADLFWPEAEPEVGRANLRTALASLRKQLEPPGTPAGSVLVTQGHGNVRLNPDTVLVDVAAFDKAVQAAARSGVPAGDKARLLSEAVGWYAGPTAARLLRDLGAFRA
jgi:DNA-binding SARP family transcriptional activator